MSDDPTYKYVPLTTHVSFDSSVFKWNKDGTRVLSDFADTEEGDKYLDMPASAHSVDVPDLDDNGEPKESDSGSLDDPGSMTQFHTTQRFPIGTRTVHKYAYDAKYYLPSSVHGGNSNYTVYHCHAWDLWEYQKASITTTSFHKTTVQQGFMFKLIQSYNDYKFGGPPPSGEAQSLANIGGYWYNGKKYK